MIEEYGNIVYFFGVGLQGGAGTLGIIGPDGHYGSAHNSFGDLFFMGGIPYFLIFINLYFTVQYKLYNNRKKNNVSLLLFMLNILFLANLMVSGAIFQPAISILFWISVVYSGLQNNKYNLIQNYK